MKSRVDFAASLYTVPHLFKLWAVTLLALFSFSFTVEAAVPDTLPEAGRLQRQHSEYQTMALGKMMVAYRNADETGKAKLLNKLLDQAKLRQELLTELVHTDPAGARRAALPHNVRDGMPPEVETLLEQKMELQGNLEVIYEDFEDGHHQLYHILNTKIGRIELQLLPENSKGIQSGTWVRAQGLLFKHNHETEGTLVLNDSSDSLEILADGASSASSPAEGAAALPNTLGEQDVLVLLVNFQNNPEQPWTPEQAQNLIFETVDDFYRENSHGQTWLAGDVYGYYTLPIDAVCDTYQIETKAKQAAAASGIDTNAYDRLIYLFPQIDNCGWTGKGTVGGTPSRAWINGSLTLRTVGHELGHNFGLQHAKRLECGDDVVDGSCYSVEYGDSLDIMGSPGFTGHFNAFNKELLGWLDGETSTGSGRINVADVDGSYQLEPYELAPGSNPKALKILRGVDSVTGKGLWYYIEYRQPLGFDQYLASYPAITRGSAFHLGTENDTNSSQWIDMTPSSSAADWNDAVLPIGNSYVDSNAGVTITTEWANSTGLSVNVSYSGESCIPGNPELSVYPAESAWVEAGSTVTYNVTVTNRDSSGCAASDFSVETDSPAGWFAEGANLNLAPGASGTVNLRVTSPASVADGFYDILIKAINSGDSRYQNSSMVTYVVDTPVSPCVPADPVLSLSTVGEEAVVAGTPVTYGFTLTNRDSDGCEPSVFTVAASVAAGWSTSGASVNLAPGAEISVNINVTSPAETADGTYQINITAKNLANNSYYDSALVNYQVAAPLNNNNAPVAVDDIVVISSKVTIGIDVLGNDTDPDGDPLTVIGYTQGSRGSVRISGDGGLLYYTPDKDFKGSDSFNYTISDGNKTDTATVRVSLVKTKGRK